MCVCAEENLPAFNIGTRHWDMGMCKKSPCNQNRHTCYRHKCTMHKDMERHTKFPSHSQQVLYLIPWQCLTQIQWLIQFYNRALLCHMQITFHSIQTEMFWKHGFVKLLLKFGHSEYCKSMVCLQPRIFQAVLGIRKSLLNS